MILKFKLEPLIDFDKFFKTNYAFIVCENHIKCKYCKYSTKHCKKNTIWRLKQHLKSKEHVYNVKLYSNSQSIFNSGEFNCK